jgi:cobalt-zinc-cadmium efflux system outer membrane protein
MRRLWRLSIAVSFALATAAFAQKSLTWEQAKREFEAANPTLLAAQVGIQESRAQEITAYLRPNPEFSLSSDGVQVTPNKGVWQPLSGVVETPGISYLRERQQKRELRRDAAQKSTEVAVSQLADQERSLLFNLRTAFVQALQQKAVLVVTRENLSYYDHLLEVSRERFKAGDIAQVDLDRLELQRVQFESDVQTALVNLRTAKIQLEMLLNDRTPVEQLDVTGPFDFGEVLTPLEEYRQAALQARPDLLAAEQSVEMARVNYKLAVANGSTDPTFSIWYSHNSSFANPFSNQSIGGSVDIPLRIFDRNQGEKVRTQLDISKNERLVEATRAQVYNDVDSAYATLQSNLTLLRPYKAKYLQMAGRVRETVSFSYQHGGASLLDFLQAQQDYRSIQLSYVNLVGAYLNAAGQLNEAVGKEVIQ